MTDQQVAGMPWGEFVTSRPLGVIATTLPDGDAHAVPVEVVVDGGCVYVWCHRTSRKARNAERTGRASIVAYKGNDGAFVRGSVRLIEDGDPGYARISGLFLSKYNRQETFGNDCLIEIEPDHITVFD